MTYQQFIDFYGTQQKAAAALGIKQPSICLWQKRGIPYLRQLQIQMMTKGKLKAEGRKLAA